MTPALLDVNLLIALSWPLHVLHRRASTWFSARRAVPFATCHATQAGFLRVSSNRKVFAEAKSPKEAFELLGAIVSLASHVFCGDSTDFSGSRFVAVDRIIGHAQVTDAHLLAVAEGGPTCSRDGLERPVNERRGYVHRIDAPGK